MAIIKLIIYILEIIVFAYIGLTILYLFLFSFLGLLNQDIPKNKQKIIRRFAVLIPGYKEDNVIVEVAQQALIQTYSQENFDVVIIADSFKPETISKLKELPIKLIEVSFEVSTKAKALNQAMKQLGDNYDVALVLDADNIMNKDFIEKINDSFNRGFKIVQGHRIAKNTNNSFAILDAVSEEINNTIFRKAHRVVGLSSALIGSGMAFDYKLFKNEMANIKAIGGFDKELEMNFLRNKILIEYVDDAYVKDEKVQKTDAFQNQRRRWLSAQFIYFGKNILPATFHLLTKVNFDYFDKTIQMGQLPRIILLGLTGIIATFYTILYFIFPAFLSINYVYWIALLGTLMFSLLISIPKQFYNKRTANAILSLPKGFFLMIISLLKFKGANKKFIHTEHGLINEN